MLYDFIITDKKLKKPMYQQIYLSIRQAIEDGSLKKGDKLPSIRGLSNDRGISKTTVTGAYDQLCVEGYIESRPQRGYYVAAEISKLPQKTDTAENGEKKSRYYAYDFSGKSIDESIIDLAEWRKNVKDIVNRSYLLTSYGDVQGEEALREALHKYALGTRSVNANAQNIVVGAGSQALLYLLCSLFGFGKTIAVEQAAFVQAEAVFRSFDYDVEYFEQDAYGVTIDSLKELSPEIVLINPNFSGSRGDSMPVNRRLEIIKWARQNNALILEDDYNGELRYRTLPIPCVQHYDVDNTVYIGSFSKVLLPSVRLSYTVLPELLMNRFNKVRHLMNQTASKTEQLALANYINYGKIDVHLRKARRVYLEKSKTLIAAVERYFPNTDYGFNETALYLTLPLPESADKKIIEEALERESVRLMPYDREKNRIALSFSGIAQEKLVEGVRILSKVISAHK